MYEVCELRGFDHGQWFVEDEPVVSAHGLFRAFVPDYRRSDDWSRLYDPVKESWAVEYRP